MNFARHFCQKFSKVYKVTKVQPEEDRIYYQPHFATNASGLICSIPVSNINKSSIRRPLKKKDFSQFFNDLLEELKKEETEINIKEIKAAIHSTDLNKKSELIARLWSIKQDEELKFTPSQKSYLESLINSLKEELAYLLNIDPQSAEQKLYSVLECRQKVF